MNVEPIVESLELVAERLGDPAPQVYARLFARYPQTEALFARDMNGAVRGEMLAVTLKSLLDLAEDGPLGANMIIAERVNHGGFDVPPDVFRQFYPIMAETFREALGADWTPAMTAAWDELLGRIADLTA